MTPLISVILPVFNGAKFLADAVKTLAEQDYAPLEIILIDDGSTDNTAELAVQYPIRYFYQANGGPAAARNLGLEVATGELIKFLDVDDLLPPASLPMLVQRLTAQPELDIVTGHIQTVVLSNADQRNHFQDATPFAGFNLGAGLFRRHVFERVGGFDASLAYASDVDWYLRALEVETQIVIVRDVTLFYQQHGQNLLRQLDRKDFRTYFLRNLQRSIARRRNPDGTVRPIREWNSLIEPIS